MFFNFAAKRPTIALILSGGGARAAYQAGVLAAVARLLPRGAPSPFRIICGTSAGALNAALLAANADDFGRGVSRAMRAWGSLSAAAVHRTDPRSVARSAGRWLWSIMSGDSRGQAVSLLDNTPLRELITRLVDFSAMRSAIERGHLDALCVTASSYDSGRSVSFFEGALHLEPWQRARRCGVRARLGPEHLLGSSAIPFIYPPERIDGEYYGDGAMQQLAPMSPALQLGADKVFIIGVGPTFAPASRSLDTSYPSFGQIGGHLLDSVFVDTVETDLERMRAINQTLALIPAPLRRQRRMNWRPVQACVINPQQSLDELAAAHVHRLPPAIRMLLRATGVLRTGRSNVLSYLLTEGAYCKRLMRQGFRDAIGRRSELAEFLGQALDTPRVAHAGSRSVTRARLRDGRAERLERENLLGAGLFVGDRRALES